MARIAGVDIPNNKRIIISLTYIYGVGNSVAKQILEDVGIDPNRKVSDISEQEISTIAQYIDAQVAVEGDLRKERAMAIKRLVEIHCYRGVRHRVNLPCRGQLTRSNARTRRGLAGKNGIKRK